MFHDQASTTPRMGLVTAIAIEMRRFSTQTVLYTQAMADRLGVNLTDLLCMGILEISGPITAGELARLTGLTTGAITGVVDRLEQAGYARRDRDPNDRRRVIVRPLTEPLVQEINPHFASMLQASSELMARYSDRELALLLDFVARSTPLLRAETAKLRTPLTHEPETSRAAE
jgi:DNA-binding MarR family transcriptional regulator